MNKIKTLLLTLGLLSLGTAQATPVAIDSLFIDYGSVAIDTSLVDATYGGSFSPVEVTMGEYQNPIISLSGPLGSTASIFSTDAYGMPAPTGTVDGSSIDVDFSSLRLGGSIASLSGSIPLWPLTTSLDTGFYDSNTGDFELTWVNHSGSGWLHKDITVTLSGYLTTVPVPAAVWLFGSGLLGLVGVARRKKA